MKKIILILFSCIVFNYVKAQVPSPVLFSFDVIQQDGQNTFRIKAQLAKDVQLMKVSNTVSEEDVFVTQIQFDSATQSCLQTKPTVIGSLQSLPDYSYYTDSVTLNYQVNAIPSNQSVQGKIIWLAKVGDEFISGEEAFNQTIPLQQNTSGANSSNQSLMDIFWICLITGLLAILTPCVFPLVPVTVSFFLKKSKNRAEGLRNAFVYSTSIISIYTIPTLLLTFIFGDKVLYTISTHPISNLLFFAIFVVFAISFFGAFELQLPNSWANKADQQASKGGVLGIFFMALTLVIVSFSCTGPIIGTLLGETSAQGFAMAPILGMLGFGVGLALPFAMFAVFPSMLQSLPKSGGWLNSVKVSFGFIELALALKFLSNVDLAYHWRLLDRDIFLILWIIIFFMLGIYLLGKIKFAHDSELKHISIPRLFFAMSSFAFALYLFPGLFGAPLKGISGWLPHTSTQDFNLKEIEYKIDALQKNDVVSSSNKNIANPPKKYADVLHAPLGLTAYFDLEEGMAAAKALNKPVMLDFTGHSCANCRKMENEVWSDPAVLERIRENFVLISLYVDDKTPLEKTEQYIAKDGNKITNLGEKNLDYEISKFGFNAQPLYMFLDLEGNLLSNEKYGYDPNKQKFIDHLDAVKKKFEESKQ